MTFGTGLAIISKLQAYDDTDAALATQVTFIVLCVIFLKNIDSMCFWDMFEC